MTMKPIFIGFFMTKNFVYLNLAYFPSQILIIVLYMEIWKKKKTCLVLIHLDDLRAIQAFKISK